ncbi:hypothetical protein PGB90_005908 [Kerria lacca]
MGEAYNLLKQVANKGKTTAAKDESSLFCDLLCLKLRALDDDTRELAMHQINNLMFSFKKLTISQPYWCHPYMYQQPGSSAHDFSYGRSRSVTPGALSVDRSENSLSTCTSSE